MANFENLVENPEAHAKKFSADAFRLLLENNNARNALNVHSKKFTLKNTERSDHSLGCTISVFLEVGEDFSLRAAQTRVVKCHFRGVGDFWEFTHAEISRGTDSILLKEKGRGEQKMLDFELSRFHGTIPLSV